MHRKLTAIAALAATAATLAAVASAGPVAAKERVSIQVRGGASFVLSRLGPGSVERDAGTATFCCWGLRQVVRDGQSIDINDPQMTLTGKHGTIVARNRIEWVDLPDGVAVFTGTWKVVRATGAYAGLAGGGRGAGVRLADGTTKAAFEGYLGSK